MTKTQLKKKVKSYVRNTKKLPKKLTVSRFVKIKKQGDLTEKQIVILEFIAHGFSTAEMGKIMKISTRTIDSNRSIIVRKLNTRNIVEATVVGIKKCIIKHNPTKFKRFLE